MTSDTTTGTGLSTLSEEGTPPKSRIEDFRAACGLVEQLREGSEARNGVAAKIRGMFDGNPPFNNAKLRSAGMSYYPNFNTLEGKAYGASAKVPYYDLFSSAPHNIEVSLELGAGNEEIEAYHSRCVTEELDRTVKDWSAFDPTMGKLIDDYVKFGKGYLMWPDPVSWKFKRIAWHRVLVPSDTDVDLSEWEYFAVLRNFNVHELYNRIRNGQTAERSGWRRDAVLSAIRTASKIDPANNQDWVGVQQQLKDHDLFVSTGPDRVETAFLFVREFSGRWTQMVVPLGGYSRIDSKTTDPNAGFLYRRTGLYEKVENIIAPFFFDVEDGSVNGLSGLGKDIFAPMQAKDRMRCAQVNNVFMRSSILMQAKSGSGRQKASLNQIGNVCVIPEGYEVQQSTVLGDIESTVVVNADIDRMLQSNTGIYRPQFEKPAGNPETATAAQLRFTQGTVLTNSAVNRFHSQLDRAYSEMYRRIVKAGDKEAVLFRKWTKERGIPNESLSKTRAVRSFRNVGNGSVYLRQTGLNNLLPLFPEMPEPGKQNFLADAVAANAGQQKVELYLPREARTNTPTRHTWEAQIENDSLKNGSPAQWTPEQDDIVHLQTHAAAVDQALKSVEQGGDPAAVAVFAQATISHCVSAHIKSLNDKGRKKQVAEWLEKLKPLGEAAQQLAEAVRKQAQQQQQLRQQQQEQLTEQQLAAQESQAKLQLKATEKGQGMQLKQAQAEQKMGITAATAAQKLGIGRAQASAKLLEQAARVEQNGRETAGSSKGSGSSGRYRIIRRK